ncbi:MAG: hypothetical protein HY716_08340 [Planctomycetes bacterium]|nr:hypothetical protein [Planctomycetota bacterium]
MTEERSNRGVAAEPATPKEHWAAKLRAQRKGRARRSFLVGLLAGQLAIVGINVGLVLAVRLLDSRVKLDEGQVPILVGLGVLGGMALTAALVMLSLFLAGIVGLFRGGSLWRGVKRSFRAVFSVAFTTLILGGTAYLWIPFDQRPEVAVKARSFLVETWERIHAAPARR